MIFIYANVWYGGMLAWGDNLFRNVRFDVFFLLSLCTLMDPGMVPFVSGAFVNLYLIGN